MRRRAGQHENFFIAKNHDSESAQRAFSRHRRVVVTSTVCRSLNARITKTPAVQVLLAILTIVGVGFSSPARIVARVQCGVPEERALRFLAPKKAKKAKKAKSAVKKTAKKTRKVAKKKK